METEIDVYLRREKFDVRRNMSMSGTHWLQLNCHKDGSSVALTVFGTPEQVDAFIDSITALRSKQQEAAEAAS